MSPFLLPQHIRTVPLLSGLAENEKDSLLKDGRLRRFERGQTLFFHGDPVTHFYIVVNGNVQLYRESLDGKEKTIEILNSGQTICENEILDACLTHRMNARTINDVTVMEFGVSWLKSSAKKYSIFALNLLSMVSEYAHRAELEAEHQATMSAPQLVACFLQRMCVLYGFNPEGFELPYSKTLIASRLGMELETFSRALSKLKSHGIIVVGTRVAIVNPERTGAYVCDSCSIASDCKAHQVISGKKIRKISESQ